MPEKTVIINEDANIEHYVDDSVIYEPNFGAPKNLKSILRKTQGNKNENLINLSKVRQTNLDNHENQKFKSTDERIVNYSPTLPKKYTKNISSEDLLKAYQTQKLLLEEYLAAIENIQNTQKSKHCSTCSHNRENEKSKLKYLQTSINETSSGQTSKDI